MKKAWKLFAALPLLACFLQAASSAVSEIPLPEKSLPGLDAILRSAVQQSPRMVNQALDLEAAENDRIAARAGLLPNVSANYSYNKSSDLSEYLDGRPAAPGFVPPSYHMVTKTPYSASLSQPLFFWGERRNNDRIGKIQQEIAHGRYRQGYRLLAQEIRGSYLHLIVQKIALKRAHFYQEYVTNQLKLQEDRLVKKVISEVEISIARLNAEQGQIALERAELEYDNAKRSFARLAGMGSIGDEAIPVSVAVINYAAGPFDQLLGEFLGEKEPETVEAYNLRQQIAVEKLNYANARTRLLPKVSAVFGLTQDEQNNIYGQGTKYSTASRYAGISINWTVFDGFASGAATRNALIRRRQLENNYQQMTEQLAQDAQTAAKQINFSARSMAITDRQFANAEGYLNTVKEDFRRGAKSESDVGQTQLNVYDAEINAGNSRSDFLIRVGDFLGTLNEDPIVANLPVK